MNPEDLDAIRRRCEAATPGPWSRDGDTIHSPAARYSGVLAAGDYDGGVTFSDADFEFVVVARRDVPALLAEVERLRAELAFADKRAERYRAGLMHAEAHAREVSAGMRQAQSELHKQHETALAEIKRLHNIIACLTSPGAPS